MSKAKFSKGEWIYSHCKGDHKRYVMCEGRRIATVAFNSGKTNPKANAHLIAAAPDHDAALCMIESKIPSTPNVFGGDYSVVLSQEEVEKIRLTLNKARGETK